MTQKQQTPNQPQAASEEALSGNPSAGTLAQKAAAMLESIMGSAVTPKLSELPTVADRLNAVADAIERQDLLKQGIGFNMLYWRNKGSAVDNRLNGSHECGTVACIAGWTTLIEGEDAPLGQNVVTAWRDGSGIADKAAKILGLDREIAVKLFMPSGHSIGDMHAISDKRAVAVIRHLVKTGNVEWNRFDNNGKEVLRP